MGQIFSTEVKMNDSDASKALQNVVKQGGVTLGGAGKSYDSLADYGNSMFSDAKEKLIRGIATDVAGILKINDSFAKKNSLKDVIDKFSKVVPDPRKNRKIIPNKDIHVDVCKQLAVAINKNYKLDLVNVDDKPENVCRAVCELLHSLFTGFHSEFFTVSADVSRVVRNLSTLQTYIDGLNKKLVAECEGKESSDAKEVYAAISREISRQHTTLSNLVSSVIGPAGDSLIHLVEENKDFPGMTDDLRNLSGTREFSDQLGYMMSGISSVAHAAHLVNKALKKIGMSVSEYKSTNNIKELRSKIYDNLVKKKPNNKDLHEMMAAADILYRNDLAHDDIAAHLSKRGGQISGGNYNFGDESEDFTGGADGGDFGIDRHYGTGDGFADMISDGQYRKDESVYKGRVHANRGSISTELRKKSLMRERLFVVLNDQISNCYDAITSDLYKIGKKIGNEIKICDDLRMFIRQLGYFSGVQPDRSNLHKALSGYRRDVNSEYIKHDFMKALESVKSCGSNLDSNANFKSLCGNITKLLDVVNNFNDTFTKTLTDVNVNVGVGSKTIGAGEEKRYIPTDTTAEPGELDDQKKAHNLLAAATADFEKVESREKQKSEPDETKNNINIKNIIRNIEATEEAAEEAKEATDDGVGDTFGGSDADFKYLVTIKKAIREIEYYFKIANIKHNLSIASVQNKGFTKDYENILGEECGMLIDKINYKYRLLTCEDKLSDTQALTHFMPVPGSLSAPAPKNLNSECIAYRKLYGAGGTINEKRWKAYLFLMEYIRSAKVEMIEATQALDIYLSKFTERIQCNPDEVKEFLKLLEQLEIVAKWFTDKSGDNLVNVFEGHDKGLFEIKSDTPIISFDKHYYVDAKLNTKSNNKPCKHKDGIVMDTVEHMRDFLIRIEKSFKSMRALENIIAVFAKFNYKIDGDIMSPGLIFKSFMKYAVASSFGIFEAGTRSPPPTFVGYLDMLPKVIDIDHTKVFLRNADGKNTYDPLHIGDDANKTGHYNTYLQTDDIYIMSIKSMVSKIFTTIGLYSLFNRPAKDFASNKAIANTHLRQILGGASKPKINSDATELYIRLTLLGEWYRDLFKFKKDTSNPDNIVVSMIPAFDGIWSKFVKVIFVDAANVTDGGYTETFSYELIDSINEIYSHYKSKYPTNTCQKVLESFVAEVNMRYGLIKQQEIDHYLDEKDKGLDDKDEYNAYDENVDYDILDSKAQFRRKQVPSDKFRKEGYKTLRNSDLKNKKFYKKVEEFRKEVEKCLNLEDLSNKYRDNRTANKQYAESFKELGLQYASVDDLVMQTRKRISGADDDDKKYNIVQSVIMGVERYSDIDYDCMLMFHETVINPLTILYTVYKMVNHWNRFANSMNVGDCKFDDPSKNGVLNICLNNLKDLPGHDKYRKNVVLGPNFMHKYLYFNDADYNRYGGVTQNLNHKNLMEDTINHLFYLTCDKNPMVEMYFSGGGDKRYPMLSFKKLESYVTNLVTCVENALVKFRKILPYDIIQKYERSTQDDFNLDNTTDPKNPNVVSLFYIKEHFIDRLIKNKYGAGLTDANTALKNIWLCLTKKDNGENYKDIFSRLTYWDSSDKTGLYNFPGRRIEDNWSKFPINKIGIHKMSTLTGGNDLTALSKWILEKNTALDNAPPNEAIRRVTTNGKLGPIGNQIMGYKCVYDYDTTNCSKSPDNKKCGIKYENDGTYEINGNEGAFGLIFKFNRLLYHYINLFTDKTSNKTYLPLLEKFANGVNANEIMKGNAIDDVSGDNVSLNALFPTKEIGSKSAIFSTMALAIRNIVTNKKQLTAITILNYAEPDLNNISEYMKDLMTAYLPIFDKQLNIICAKADLMKSLIEQTRVVLAGGYVPGDNVVQSMVKQDGIAEDLKEPKLGDEAKNKSHMIDMLSHICASAKSLQKCVTTVYKELADVPIYFETYKNSISDYENRNSVLPLMPLSHTSHLLNNQMRLVKGNDILPTPMDAKYGGWIIFDTTDDEKATKFRNFVDNNTLLDNIEFVKQMDEQKSVYKEFVHKLSNNINIDPFNQDSEDNRLIQFIPYMKKSLDNLDMKYNIIMKGIKLRKSDTKPSSVFKEAQNQILKAGKKRKARLQYHTYKGLIPHCDVGVGSEEFKFAYGTRGLLSDNMEPNIELAPGVLGVLDTYNAKVGGAASYDKKKMVDCFTYCTHLLRFATDYTYHKTYLGDQDLDKLTGFYIVGTHTVTGIAKNGVPFAPPMVPGTATNVNVLQHLACQTGKHALNDVNLANGILASNDQFFINTNNITLLVENDNYKQSVYRMLRCIVDESQKEHMHFGTRKDLRIYNILDANIVPINFHALQRELPLINIFNYSYTFDQLVCKEYGVNAKLDEPGDAQNDIETRENNYRFPGDTLVQILTKPLGKRTEQQYLMGVMNLMVGRDNLTLNKPKYLSDQLWNKVLCNTVYMNDTRGDRIQVKKMGHDALMNYPGWINKEYDAAGPLTLADDLYYQNSNNLTSKHDLNIIPVGTDADLGDWTKYGYERYNTVIVRWIEWFVHLQRVMRLLMKDQLDWVNDPIVHKRNILSEHVTDYDSNKKFEIADFE